MTIVQFGLFVGPLAVRLGSVPGAWGGFYGAWAGFYGGLPHSALMQRVWSLVLPQLNTPGLVDTPREVLYFLKSGWGGETEGEKGAEIVVDL